MADTSDDGKGDGTAIITNISTEASEANENVTSAMEVDPPAAVPTETLVSSDEKEEKNISADETSNAPSEKETDKTVNGTTDDEFLVLEEDDGNEDEGEGNQNKANADESFNTPEPMDAASTVPTDKESTEKEPIEESTKTNGEEGAKDNDVMLANPLFGTPGVPVIDIDSSSNSDDDSEEDFSADVKVNNFQMPEDANAPADVDLTESDGPLPNSDRQEGCSCNCYFEKGILVNEIERLRKAVFELSERHSVIEDFIEVEYSERFEKFLKNREHLVSMGFGGKESGGSEDLIDGKRSSKSAELIELLKMIKEQSTANVKEEPGTSSASQKKSSSKGSSGSTSSQSRNQSKQSKPKPIPSISSSKDRDRGSSSRGGALNYNQRPVMLPPAAVPHVMHPYQQQALAAQHQALLQQQRQAQYQFESMYGRAGSGRDVITAVGRTELYPSSSSAASQGYGYGNRSDTSYESKRQRKRKRNSEVSSEGGSAGVSGSSKNNSGKGKQSGAGRTSSKKTADDFDEVEVIDYNQGMNLNAKRICPLCEKIVNRKALRDHLAIQHQGHIVACPVCQTEFRQRRNIKTHMRDAHNLPLSEYSAYIEKIYSNIEEQCGPWLDKCMQEAALPTKEQLLVYNAEIQLAMLNKQGKSVTAPVDNPASKRGTGAAATTRAPAPTASSGGGRRGNSWGDGNRSSQGGSSTKSQQSVRYFTGANSKVSSKGRASSTTELYGPGGYADYAARYLQQRASNGGW